MVKNHSVVPNISYLLQKHSNNALQVRKYLKKFRKKHYYFQLLVVLVGVIFLFIAR